MQANVSEDKNRWRERLANIRCFALDMDGTFYLGESILPGSLDFIEAVRKSGRRFLFLTNNSSHDAAYYQQRLARMGLDVPKETVYTSGQATAQFLQRTHPGARVYVLGNSFLHRELSEGGVCVVEDDPEVVVAGFDTTLDFAKMTKMCDFVRNDLPFYATHPDFNCPVEGGGCIPDCGAILAFIEASTNRRPDAIIGKPYGEIVRGLLERTELTAEQIAMVGDRLYTDIRTGVDHGLLSILVLTGETTLEQARQSTIQPDIIAERLASLIPYM